MSEAGRPSKFKKKYCSMLIDHMSRGLSFDSFAGVLGVTRATIYNWVKDFPEFLDAKSIGRSKGLLFDEELLTKGAEGKQRGYNIAAHKWKMANMYKWSERQTVDEKSQTININLSQDDLDL